MGQVLNHGYVSQSRSQVKVGGGGGGGWVRFWNVCYGRKGRSQGRVIRNGGGGMGCGSSLNHVM